MKSSIILIEIYFVALRNSLQVQIYPLKLEEVMKVYRISITNNVNENDKVCYKVKNDINMMKKFKTALSELKKISENTFSSS